MRKRFVVLGGYGIIGKVVALDFFKTCRNCEIIIAGRDIKKAKQHASSFNSSRVKAVKADVTDINETASLLKNANADVCVNCVQYYFNIPIMKACVKAKTNYLDLGGLFHVTRQQLKLHNAFKKINKTAILGCGSTPGITNIMAAYGSKFLEKINSIEIVFADVDKTIYAQKFVLPYSFNTLIDEYTKEPAVYKNSRLMLVNPGSGEKIYNFKLFGKQKGFYSLHSELATFPQFFKNKGIRNVEFRVTFSEEFNKVISSLIELGFASKDKLQFNNSSIPIIDITSVIMDKLLPKKSTKLKDKEMLRVDFNNGKLLIDSIANSTYNIPAGIYDTAVPCSIISQMLAFNQINASGVYPPERIINPILFFRELGKRGIKIFKNNKHVN